jgi:hypothetical protein
MYEKMKGMGTHKIWVERTERENGAENWECVEYDTQMYSYSEDVEGVGCIRLAQ